MTEEIIKKLAYSTHTIDKLEQLIRDIQHLEALGKYFSK